MANLQVGNAVRVFKFTEGGHLYSLLRVAAFCADVNLPERSAFHIFRHTSCGQVAMNEKEELAHLRAPSADPKQQMIDYWGRRAEKAEAQLERLRIENDKLRDEADHAIRIADLWKEKARRALEKK